MTLTEIIELERAKGASEVLLFREGLFLKAYEGSAQQLALRYGFKVSARYVKRAGQLVASVGFPAASLATYLPQAAEAGGHWRAALPVIAAQPLQEWKDAMASGSSRCPDAEVAEAVRRFPMETATPIDCMQFLARLKRMLLLICTVFFIIGPVRGGAAFVVVCDTTLAPRPSNTYSPAQPEPQLLWERLVAGQLRLADSGYLRGFAFSCRPTAIAADGTRTRLPMLLVEADPEGVTYFAPRRTLRATADTLWLSDSRHGTWLRCPRTAAAGRPDYYRMIFDECFHGIDRCCPVLFAPNAQGQAAPVSTRYAVFDSARCQLFTLPAPPARSRDGRPTADTVTVCYSYDQGAVIWAERREAGGGRMRFDLSDWHLSTIPYAPRYASLRLTRASASAAGYRCYDLPRQCPLWLCPHSTGGRVLSYGVARYPLVGADGDTVRLADDPRWRLVVLWDYGCCGWQQLQALLAAGGQQRLERAGISLYCINPFGGSTPYFRSYARQSGLQQILFVAQDLRGLDCQRLPACYLYRPDGRLAGTLSGEQCSIDTIMQFQVPRS